MPEGSHRKTAVIYPFTPRPRGAEARKNERGTVQPLAGLTAAPCGSGWYHDAAIREATPDRKP